MSIERVTGVDEKNFGFDELVAVGARVHIERMSRDHIWMQVGDRDRVVTLNFHIKKRTMWVNVDDDRLGAARSARESQ